MQNLDYNFGFEIEKMALASKVSSVFRSDLFTGKVAVVTGGATGIGRAITEELVHLGCKVVIASRKEERLKQAANEINTAVENGTEPVLPVQCNTRKEDEVRHIITTRKLKGEAKDFLIHLHPRGPYRDHQILYPFDSFIHAKNVQSIVM